MKLTLEIIGRKPGYMEGEPGPVQRPLELQIEVEQPGAIEGHTPRVLKTFAIYPHNLDELVLGIEAVAGDDAAALVRASILAYVEELGDSARHYVNYGRACMDAWSELAGPVREALGRKDRDA